MALKKTYLLKTTPKTKSWDPAGYKIASLNAYTSKKHLWDQITKLKRGQKQDYFVYIQRYTDEMILNYSQRDIEFLMNDLKNLIQTRHNKNEDKIFLVSNYQQFINALSYVPTQENGFWKDNILISIMQ